MKEFLRNRTQRLFNFIKLSKKLISLTGEGCPLVFNFRSYSANNFIRQIIKFLVTPFMIIKYFLPVKNLKREGLAIALIAKNEAQYITEWINFHVKQGVSHFFIYDNESTDNLYETLQPFIKRGLVTYKKFPGKIRQNDAYNHAIYHYKRKFKYFAMIDADEFLFVRNNTQGGGGAIQIS
ncbi:MAG: glycosyltransferase family 2 protein [Synergistaceae bacterium]|nr:glycosyltransferase family 2 protein [Synergistaceae bacterium]